MCLGVESYLRLSTVRETEIFLKIVDKFEINYFNGNGKHSYASLRIGVF